ncbi:hypothetical protein YPPY04_4887, partial [Yersinia pestis PY-04]
MARRTG